MKKCLTIFCLAAAVSGCNADLTPYDLAYQKDGSYISYSTDKKQVDAIARTTAISEIVCSKLDGQPSFIENRIDFIDVAANDKNGTSRYAVHRSFKCI